MPIYEYACAACEKTFEARQKITDAPLTACTQCGQGPVDRLVSNTSFVLKGSGWYKTDYAGGGKKADGAGDAKTGDSDGKGKPTGAGETSAAKAEPAGGGGKAGDSAMSAA